MPTDAACALWRRLDTPGHDAAWLERTAGGWLLSGTAVYRRGVDPACLAYEVACDAAWATIQGSIRGRIGDVTIAHEIARSAGGWTVDGAPVPGLADLLDLDLGFTPATNQLQLRRVGLAVGEAADVTAAWFAGEPGAAALIRLPQRFERRGEHAYRYEAPTAGYAGELLVGAGGFVTQYPGLWEAASAS